MERHPGTVHFVFKENEINRDYKRLSPPAFEPKENKNMNGRLELSACEKITDDEIKTWHLGEKLLNFRNSLRKPGSKNLDLKGRSDMVKTEFENQKLEIEYAPSTAIPEHINVIEWKKAEFLLRKPIEQIALNLSLKSKFIEKPSLPRDDNAI